MSQNEAEVIIAGHICLDIIPTIYDKQSGMDAYLVPGKLVDSGPAVISTGGAVSNTGTALHRLSRKYQLQLSRCLPRQWVMGLRGRYRQRQPLIGIWSFPSVQEIGVIELTSSLSKLYFLWEAVHGHSLFILVH
ncbi:hypothetical protein LOZ80_04965 [Paenibacillus sp. HWE-109]|uniref:hypothetical protein n=1 Tax=Paenibacillus sp. HWE-109 TaxID=1306526 RepID=UPI001EDE6A56|nr:hypothetical protein [Paenibacillus sp. HWE-109]UKS28290.1 hypothetical protein LOZ80_04965 [Paenibacillus sp. HWE-109]